MPYTVSGGGVTVEKINLEEGFYDSNNDVQYITYDLLVTVAGHGQITVEGFEGRINNYKDGPPRREARNEVERVQQHKKAANDNLCEKGMECLPVRCAAA